VNDLLGLRPQEVSGVFVVRPGRGIEIDVPPKSQQPA
jgi:hypothetical protein